MNYKKPKLWMVLLSVSVLIAVGIALMSNPIDATAKDAGVEIETLVGDIITEIDKISQENYETIASEFDIDLSEYRYLEPTDTEYKSSNLFLLRIQFNSNTGDLVPRIYLDESRKGGIILKQDKNGLNYMYNFEADDDKWIITNIKEKQGAILQDYYEIQDWEFNRLYFGS